jgi:hypothetical protein
MRPLTLTSATMDLCRAGELPRSAHAPRLRLLLALTLAAGALAGCGDSGGPTAPPAPEVPTELRGLTIRVDVGAGTASLLTPGFAQSEVNAPSFALLGINEVGVISSNFFRSAVGQFTKKMVRVRFDVALKNKLAGAVLVPATFPQPPLGNQDLMLFPFQISNVIGGGSVMPSTDWDRSPYNFFNDLGCASTGITSDCYRWEAYPAPLGPSATAAARTVGFDVSPTVQSFLVTLVLAADLQNLEAKSSKIVYASGANDAEIYVMNSDGSGKTNLTANRAVGAAMPVWSPDGKKIAFVSLGGADVHIYVMNADGSGQTQLTRGTGDFNPTWSKDGTKIAFESTPEGSSRWQIFVINSDGSGLIRLTNNNRNDIEPSWSGDGTKIAFVTDRDDPYSEIYSMNADGSGQTRLTNNATPDRKPGYSRDGTKIAFESDVDGVAEIYSMNPDGSGQTRLTNHAGPSEMPNWSGDGTQIVFSGLRDNGYGIYTMNADGSRESHLASGRDPDWSRDGATSTPPPPPPPPPFLPSTYDGRWTVTPALNPTCTGITGSVVNLLLGSFTGFDVQRTAVNLLAVTPRIGGLLGAQLSQPTEIPYTDGAPLDAVRIEMSQAVSQSGFTGTGTLLLIGTFTTTTFSGSLDVAFQGSLAGAPVSCTMGSPTLTATKGL